MAPGAEAEPLEAASQEPSRHEEAPRMREPQQPREERQSEPRREERQSEPRREQRQSEPRREERVEPSSAPLQAPPSPAPHVEFHAVSEHEEVEEPQAARPHRRRRAGHDAAEAAQAPLQLVETQVEAVAAPQEEEELPRRTRPRRRRSAPVPSEPLQLVETQSPAAGDNAPTP